MSGSLVVDRPTTVRNNQETTVVRSDDQRDNQPKLITYTAASPPTAPDDLPSFGSPMEKLIDQWVEIAVRHARVRLVDDVYVADVAGLPGAWAEGDSPEEAVAQLPEVLSSWVTLKLDDNDDDIPPMEGVKLVLSG